MKKFILALSIVLLLLFSLLLSSNINMVFLKKIIKLDTSPQKEQVLDLIFPIDVRDCIIKYKRVELTGWFNEKRWYGLHRAYDIPVVEDTPIRMPMNGKVSKIYSFGSPKSTNGVWRAGYGLYMEIEFEYQGETITMLFAHLNKILVLEGDILRQGEIIALSGSTGLVTTKGVFRHAPHVHLEAYKNGVKVPFHKELGDAVKKELNNEKDIYAFTLRTPIGTNN